MVPNLRPLIVEFAKMSGAGNDFIVLDNRFYNFSEAELGLIARFVCRRRHGIGADGILALAAPQSEEAHYRIIYFNADGSEGTMCGNGVRCLVRYARQAGFNTDEVIFEAISGLYKACVLPNPSADVRIYFRPPTHWQPSLDLDSPLPDAIIDAHYLWPGTEHVICFTSSVDQALVEVWGRAIRHDTALLPAGANVNFVEICGPSALTVRTFEKGVEGETLACGTGAVASAMAAQHLGRIMSERVTVQMPGGTLYVGAGEDFVYLEGPAVSVYRGSFELDTNILSL